jgi:phosphoribosylformimino-5-aminoimidazole carboxamide ribotide isomerase
MIILPAIDLLDGACVRLTRGSYDRVRRYSRDPVEVAREFEAAGACWIHVVDLDAARGGAAGGPSAACRRNRRVIHDIGNAVSCRIEVGGGVRTLADVEELLKASASRLIVGTTLVKDPEEVKRWCAVHPGVLWAGIDADEGMVRVSGWQQEVKLQDLKLAGQVREMGLAGIVYTSIGRDGTLEGPDIERTNRIAEVSGLPVILSGGIGGPEDVQRVLRRRHPGVEGLIIGKAIYQGRVDLKELLRSDSPTSDNEDEGSAPGWDWPSHRRKCR